MDAALEEESLANDEGDRKQYSDEAYDSPDQEIRPDVEHGRVVIVVHLVRALKCAGRQARHVPSQASAWPTSGAPASGLLQHALAQRAGVLTSQSQLAPA